MADVFLCKLDKDANFEWVKSFGGFDYSHGTGVKADALGNVYFTGIFLGSMDFDSGPGTLDIGSKGRGDFFVSKFDKDGNQQWVHTFGSSSENDEVTSLAVDGSNNIYLAGYFSGLLDFDPGTTVSNLSPVGENNNFLLKLDANGAYEWAINAVGSSLTIGPNDGVYLTGKFKNEFDFDPSENNAVFNSEGAYDVAISKYEATGKYLWALTFGGEGYDSGQNIDANQFGNFTVSGSFNGNVNFNAEAESLEASSELNDIFIYRFQDEYTDEEGEEEEEEEDEVIIKIAPNPTDGLINITFEKEPIQSIVVTDINGKVVYSMENIDQNTFSFNLDSSTGLYFLKIKTATERKVLKLMRR